MSAAHRKLAGIQLARGIAALLLFAWAPAAQADVKLPPFISSHMVLQRAMSVPVWGIAAPGEKITVKFRNQEKSAAADASGSWSVKLDPLTLGPPATMTVSGDNTLTLTDVLVGEVWVGSGQSNMSIQSAYFSRSDPELAQIVAENHPEIRLARANSPWVVAEPRNSAQFSALLLAFGVKLQQEQNVPVGLLVGAVGGSPSRTWVTEEMLNADPASKAVLDEMSPGGGPNPAPQNVFQTSGSFYAALIKPIAGFGIRGVLWDQGENGTGLGRLNQYTLMGALIKGWRKEWNQGDFPFLYVQKPSGGGCAWDYCLVPLTQERASLAPLPANVPNGFSMAMRGPYLRMLDYPNTAMVISSDLGGGTHPPDKARYGARAALVAQGFVYGGQAEYYGPKYASHTIDGAKVRIEFTHAGKGLTFRNGDRLQGFAIAGANKRWVWADAQIEGGSVIVTSDQVSRPVAVSYAWSSPFPWANLFNKDGLPAISFRTDPW